MMLRKAMLVTAVMLCGPVFAQDGGPPALEFLPPDLAPRDLCGGPSPTDTPSDLRTDGGSIALTDAVRIRFLARDIRAYARADAVRYHDFIQALITRRAAIDESFAGVEESLERVALALRAGRLQALRDRGTVPGLVAQADTLDSAQKVRLAQYLRTGVGIEADPAGARALLRDAAFGGNAEALLEIARLAMAGTPVEGWDAPLDLTVTMAFGGMLGELSPGLCDRAERIAQEYLQGGVVQANPRIAYAWRRFAADMGDAEAAWRVVEYHLSAGPERRDNGVLRRYLARAVERGLGIDGARAARLLADGVVSAEGLQAMLGPNPAAVTPRARSALAPHLDLGVRLDGERADESGLEIQYLREIAGMDEAPGAVFTRLAKEVAVREGRWKAEDTILRLLEEAARRGDGEGMILLAERLVRYRDEPATFNRAENLLIRAAEMQARPEALDRLDALYRCQAPDAPRLAEADHWAAQFRASGAATFRVSATDLVALDPFKDPETIARIQTRALRGDSGAIARMAQRVRSGGTVSEAAARLWADRLEGSRQALEAFAEMEFELATGPAERAEAVELFRRVYLNNGVTTALDLAIALIEDDGRDPEIAREIVDLLRRAGNRGEGAAIRLLSRLEVAGQTPRAVYDEFSQVIDERGDFLALMYAIPFLDDRAMVDDYVDRAVSIMSCGTKDADELGDAYAHWQDAQGSHHWRRVGLHFEGGHVLSRLRLSLEQMGDFGRGRAPSALEAALRDRADGVPGTHRRLYRLTADPDGTAYDPEAAAEHFAAGLREDDLAWALDAFRAAAPGLRRRLGEAVDIAALYRRGGAEGGPDARFALAMLLREAADSAEDLARSARWLRAAAEGGHDEAMVELAFALGFGLGVPRDAAEALDWLDRAVLAHNPRAEDLAARVRLAMLSEEGG